MGKQSKRLTDIAVRNAKPAAARQEIPDGGSGLYLVVQPSGATSWAHRYPFDGKREKLTLGPVYAPREGEPEPEGEPEIGKPLTLAQARRLVADQQHQLKRRENPAAAVRARKAPDQSDLFTEVAVRFLTRHEKEVRPTTYRETERGLRDAQVAWKGRRVQDIAKRDVIALLDEIEDARGAGAADKTLASVRVLFNWSAERDLVATSPTRSLTRRASPPQRERVLKDDELRLVLLAATRMGGLFCHLVWLLALTGARRDEWAEARWSEVSHNRQVFELPGERSKNGLAFELPLSSQALAALDALQKLRLAGEPDCIFSTGYGRRKPKPGEALVLRPISGFSKWKSELDATMLEIAREEAKKVGGDPAEVNPIEPWRLHDLRRTAVSNMARLGVPLEVIERAVNHISGSFAGVVGVYQKHSYAAEIRTAMERLGGGIERVANGEPLVLAKVVPIRAKKR